jgi:uncharacterized membrane protein YeaQ/YmgE (transglycosylase-associated protein family)
MITPTLTEPTLLAFIPFETSGIIMTCVIGLIIGVIAKLLMPGKDPGGCIITIIIGLVGSWIGGLISRALFSQNGMGPGLIMSVIGAMLLLWLYRVISKRA